MPRSNDGFEKRDSSSTHRSTRLVLHELDNDQRVQYIFDQEAGSSRLNDILSLTEMEMRRIEMIVHMKVFYEFLARQNTVAHLFQLQLGFRRRRIWVSVLSHMGFSHRRSVLKATI